MQPWNAEARELGFCLGAAFECAVELLEVRNKYNRLDRALLASVDASSCAHHVTMAAALSLLEAKGAEDLPTRETSNRSGHPTRPFVAPFCRINKNKRKKKQVSKLAATMPTYRHEKLRAPMLTSQRQSNRTTPYLSDSDGLTAPPTAWPTKKKTCGSSLRPAMSRVPTPPCARITHVLHFLHKQGPSLFVQAVQNKPFVSLPCLVSFSSLESSDGIFLTLTRTAHIRVVLEERAHTCNRSKRYEKCTNDAR